MCTYGMGVGRPIDFERPFMGQLALGLEMMMPLARHDPDRAASVVPFPWKRQKGSTYLLFPTCAPSATLQRPKYASEGPHTHSFGQARFGGLEALRRGVGFGGPKTRYTLPNKRAARFFFRPDQLTPDRTHPFHNPKTPNQAESID